MADKLNLGILFGGRSCEHEVSVTSAISILKAIDPHQYNLSLIGIDKSGHWQLATDLDQIIENGKVRDLLPDSLSDSLKQSVSIDLHHQGNLTRVIQERHLPVPRLDVIFPVLHGTFGEDGTLQGALEMAGLPYVGCGVVASALAMDKALAKKVFAAEGIPQAPYLVCTIHDWRRRNDYLVKTVEQTLGYPSFIKPANMGSSVGINKAANHVQLISAINHAFDFDNKIVIEQAMQNCREVECSILGNEHPRASVIGEIIPGAEFYNYETKYLDDKSRLVIPAALEEKTSQRIRQLAIAGFKAIDGAGLARVDFFVNRETNQIFLNEINTMPGFTPISMYPQLWAASGITYPQLIDRLIQLALEQHQLKQSLKRSF